MADSRHSFTRNLYIAAFSGAGIVVALHLVATFLLLRAVGLTLNPRALVTGLLLVAGGAIVITWFLVRRFINTVLKPAGRAAAIALRVSQGDLRSISESESRSDGKDMLTQSIFAMVRQLRLLVETIHGTAAEAAAMAQEIAASTEEMTASTEEVAGTTGDLTERAAQQAIIVRAAADDASKILEIAKVLASGAGEAATRNAALAWRRARTGTGWIRAPQNWRGSPRKWTRDRRKPMPWRSPRARSEVRHPDQGDRQADPHAGAQRLDRGGPCR